MSFVDFVGDLIWGASEFYLAKRKSLKAAASTEAVDQAGRAHENTGGDERAGPSDALTDREKIERLIGNKTV
ncbi:MAG TPA: hypothetical protein VMF32_06070 [Xanthobacteraceae bacterium]|nr:hypothetical protein [Xanthobacteraceae bacterium]